MTLIEKINLENLKMFKEFFLEDDEDIKYVVREDDRIASPITDKIISREELLELIHKNKLKIEYVEHGEFSLGVLSNIPVRIEYL